MTLKLEHYTVQLIFFFISAILLVFIYEFELAEMNAYFGYIKYKYDLVTIIFNLSLLISLLCFVSEKINKPSDAFVFLYFLFVIFPYFIFYSIRRDAISDYYFFEVSLLVVPIFSCILMSSFTTKIKFENYGFITYQNFILFISFVCVIGVLLALLNSTPSASFALDSSYVRRAEGRLVYATGSPQAYLNSIMMNSFAPLLAFYSVLKSKVVYFAISIVCWLAFFYLIGVKAPLLYILMSAVLGYMAKSNKLKSFLSIVSSGVLCTLIISIIEIVTFDYSYIADYIIRRSFTVPPYVISTFFDFFYSADSLYWNAVSGVNSNSPITFIIGEEFLGHPGLNANTNAFIYALGSGGGVLYVFIILMVGFIFSMLDVKYKKTKNPILIYTAFLYSILIIEQSATTALVSSGLGVIIVCSYFLKSNDHVTSSLEMYR